MKNIIMLLSLMTLFVLIILYFFFLEPEAVVEDDSLEPPVVKTIKKNITNSVAQDTQIKTLKKKIISKSNTETTTIQKNTRSEQDRLAELKDEKEFTDKIEVNWKRGVKSFFKDQLKLSNSVYEDYLELRTEAMKERDLAYNDYIERLKDQYGDDYKNRPDAAHEIFQNERYSEYANSLSELIGPENIEKYYNYKADYNESLEDILEEDQEELMIEY